MGVTAAKGYAIGATVGATAATVGAVAAPAAAAATAFALSTAIGTAIPIPLLGTAIGAVVGAFVAAGIALKAGLKDTFHPDARLARAWLLIFQIAPGMLYAGVDTITTEGAHRQSNLIHPRTGNAQVYAARLVRYFRLVAGIIANASGKLYNSNDTGEHGSNANPYIESGTPDPGESLTDVKVTKAILDLVNQNGGDPTTPKIVPHIRSKAEAQAALNLLRSKDFADSGIANTDPFKKNEKGLWRNVQLIRKLAGENPNTPDPVLDSMFHVDPRMGSAEGGSSVFGYVVLVGTGIAGTAAAWSLWKAYQSLPSEKKRK